MDQSSSTQTLPDRLLTAAIDEFGRRGVEGASTRAIAAAAGTTMSMITYHHGSKEGLYLAAAQRIASEIGERITPALAAAGASDGDDAQAALAGLLALVNEFVGVMVCPESEAWARFIVREQMDPTPAFDILYGGVMGRLVDHLSALVGRASGGRISGSEARLRTLAIVGQALVFRFARATVLRATGWTGIEEEEAAAIRRVVRTHTTAILADVDGDSRA